MQILWIAENKGREYIRRLEASQQVNVQHLGLSMYMYRKNGWPRRKSFCGIWIQSISTGVSVPHLQYCSVTEGWGRDRKWSEKHCYQSWHFNIERL